MKIKINKIAIGILFPVLILFLLISQPIITVIFGDEITLETRPIDPRDIFRGDYVSLDYKISIIDINKLVDIDEKSFYNKDLYIVLKKESKYYEVDYVSKEKPTNKIFLRGRILGYNFDFENDNNKEYKFVRIDYNLDRFYIQENTGKELEELARKGELLAKIKIRNGYGIITDIYPE